MGLGLPEQIYNRWPWVMPFVLAANAPHFHPGKMCTSNHEVIVLTNYPSATIERTIAFIPRLSIRTRDPFVFRLRYLDIGLVCHLDVFIFPDLKFMSRGDDESSYFLFIDPHPHLLFFVDFHPFVVRSGTSRSGAIMVFKKQQE